LNGEIKGTANGEHDVDSLMNIYRKQKLLLLLLHLCKLKSREMNDYGERLEGEGKRIRAGLTSLFSSMVWSEIFTCDPTYHWFLFFSSILFVLSFSSILYPVYGLSS
jgi:hypothetical protein